MTPHEEQRMLNLLDENLRAIREVQATLGLGNGKTALAVLTERVDHLSADVGKLGNQITDMGRGLEQHNATIAVLKDRMNVLAGLEAMLTLVASSVAAFIGAKK